MLCFPGMIVKAAENAGMKVPEDPDKKWDPNTYPHFEVFCNIQLGRPIDWQADEPHHNAQIIAKIPEDKIRTITLCEILALGIRYKQ